MLKNLKLSIAGVLAVLSLGCASQNESISPNPSTVSIAPAPIAAVATTTNTLPAPIVVSALAPATPNVYLLNAGYKTPSLSLTDSSESSVTDSLTDTTNIATITDKVSNNTCAVDFCPLPVRKKSPASQP